MNNVEKFRQIATELGDLYEAKDKCYNNSFGDTYNKLGIISAVTRISDKYNRLCNLATNADIDNLGESLEDTLRDMAAYCIMTVIELKKEEDIHTDDEIRAGDRFECIKDVVMDDGKIAYRRYGVYISDADCCITDLQCNNYHSWGNPEWKEFFKRVR